MAMSCLRCVRRRRLPVGPVLLPNVVCEVEGSGANWTALVVIAGGVEGSLRSGSGSTVVAGGATLRGASGRTVAEGGSILRAVSGVAGLLSRRVGVSAANMVCGGLATVVSTRVN